MGGIGVTESEAIVAARAGDWDAVASLYRSHAEMVRRAAQAIVGSPHDAEDVAQAVFARLPAALRRYEPRDVAFASWLTRVARNAALDHVRARRQIPCESVRVTEPTDDTFNAERRRALCEGLSELPTDQREVMYMHHVIGLSAEEIALRMGRSEGAVHGLHHRGRRMLRGLLTDREAAPVVRVA